MSENIAEDAHEIKISSEMEEEAKSNQELRNTTNTNVEASNVEEAKSNQELRTTTSANVDGLHDGTENIQTSKVNVNQLPNHSTATKENSPQMDDLEENATNNELLVENIKEDSLELAKNVDAVSSENDVNSGLEVSGTKNELLVENTKEDSLELAKNVDAEVSSQNDLNSEKNDISAQPGTVPLLEPKSLEKSLENERLTENNTDQGKNDSTTTKNDFLVDDATVNEGEENKNVPNSDCDKNQKVANLTKANETAKCKHKADGYDDDDAYAKHVTYTEDGSAIYTDPETHYKYKWNEEQNNWVPCDELSKTASSTASSATGSPYENEHYKWCSETQQWLPKAQAQQQQTETEHYKWDAAKNEWILKKQEAATREPATTADSTTARVTYDIDEDGQRIYTDKDGAVYFWDAEKKAWFPKIDDDFMARYQMNYGFIDNTSAGEEEKRLKAAEELKLKEIELKRMTEEAKAAAENDAAATAGGGAGAANLKRKAAQEPPKWFDMDPEQNTKVYVSNLPADVTLDEFAEVMGKCGMIMRDAQTQKFKLKLYAEANGQLKGDGLCDYIKVESVDLALNILDDYNLRGHKLHVQRAKFQMRGEYNPALKPKRKKKDKEKLLKMKEKLFDWRPEKMRGERTKNEKVVILKNLFHPEIFEKEVQLILDYQTDLREECGKCGTVRKVVIYDRHAEGVAQVNMSSPEEADLVIQMMQGRFFGKRQLTAEHWDGKTKYKINESETEVQKRLTNWDQFLETEEEHKNKEEAKEIAQQDKAKVTAPEADSTTLPPVENTLALRDN